MEPRHGRCTFKNDVPPLLDNECVDVCWQLQRAPADRAVMHGARLSRCWCGGERLTRGFEVCRESAAGWPRASS